MAEWLDMISGWTKVFGSFEKKAFKVLGGWMNGLSDRLFGKLTEPKLNFTQLCC